MKKEYKIIYVYDALCGWCYGFSQVIAAYFDIKKDFFEFEVISGGMMIGERSGTVAQVAPYIKTTYKTVEEATGIKFGELYLRHLEKGTMILDSEKPAIALSVFKSYLPDLAIPFVHDLQIAIYFDGKDPNDFELYRYLAVNFGIDPDEFEAAMQEEDFKEKAHYDFALARQLHVQGYPAVLVQTGESKFYLVAKGYTDFETLETRINNVMKELEDN